MDSGDLHQHHGLDMTPLHTTDIMSPMFDNDRGMLMTGMEMDMSATSSASSSNGFCKGEMAMVMLMEGFQWALKGESDCINLFFATWTLNTRWKFLAAMIGITLLGIATEGITKLRHDLSKKAKAAKPEQYYVFTVIQTGLHGLHAFMGYMLMLAVMTFAWELFLSVVLGLAIGYVLFGGNTYTFGSTNPCCAFMEDETFDDVEPPLEILPTSVVQENSDGTGQNVSCCAMKKTTTKTNMGGSSLTVITDTMDCP